MRSLGQKFTLKVTRRLPSFDVAMPLTIPCRLRTVGTNPADQNAQLSDSREVLCSRNANLTL